MCTHRKICNIARAAGDAAAVLKLSSGAILQAMVIAAESAGETIETGALDLFQAYAEEAYARYKAAA